VAGGSGSWPRMASSALSDELNCCKQSLPEVTVLPSYPAHRLFRESFLEAQVRQSTYAGGKDITYEVGNKVWLST